MKRNSVGIDVSAKTFTVIIDHQGVRTEAFDLSNENFNGLLRQYLPKRTSQAGVTQRDCDRIAKKLNTRPRKRLAYRTPEECFLGI